MRLWVTRPLDDAANVAAMLAAQGHDAVVEPLLAVHFLELADAACPPQFVVATSRNAVRAVTRGNGQLPDALAKADWIVVGDATAQLAAEAGARSVAVGAGTARDLVDPIVAAVRSCDQAAGMRPGTIVAEGGGRVLHLRGVDVAFDLAGALSAHGITLAQSIVYEARPTQAPSARLAAQISAGELGGVLLFSPRTSHLYIERLTALGLTEAARKLHHFCLSEAVATPIRAAGLGFVGVSAKPNVKKMLELIG